MKTVIWIVVIIAVLAVAGAVLVGERTFEGTVVDKPYDRGLLWDTEERMRLESGITAELKNTGYRIGENELIIAIRDKNGMAPDVSALSVIVSRPSTTAYDSRYTADKGAKGLYHSRVQFRLFGYWNVRIEVDRPGGPITFERRIFAER